MADEIIKVLDELCKKFGIAVDWTSENVIPYIQQLCEKYIRYEIWTSVGWILLWGIIFIVSAIFFTNRNKAVKQLLSDSTKDWFDVFQGLLGAGWVTSIIFFSIAGLIFIPVMFSQTMDIITCLTFPEKMIVEYIQELMHSGG